MPKLMRQSEQRPIAQIAHQDKRWEQNTPMPPIFPDSLVHGIFLFYCRSCAVSPVPPLPRTQSFFPATSTDCTMSCRFLLPLTLPCFRHIHKSRPPSQRPNAVAPSTSNFIITDHVLTLGSGCYGILLEQLMQGLLHHLNIVSPVHPSSLPTATANYFSDQNAAVMRLSTSHLGGFLLKILHKIALGV